MVELAEWRFSEREIKDLLVSLIALSIIFSVPEFLQRNVRTFFLILPTLGLAFILHELAHKFAAQRYGFFAEYRMDVNNLLLAFFLIFFTSMLGTPIVFAAPGAVMIFPINAYGRISSVKDSGRISVAGPLTNLVLSSIFASALYLGVSGFAMELAKTGLMVNAFLAFFNLLPIGPLDGAKIWAWKKGVWALMLALALIAMGL